MDAREQIRAKAMRAGRRGDAAAYERQLAEVADLLRRFVRVRLSRLNFGTAETEDIVQEVLIGLHTKRHTWDETRPFLPWLNAIAHYKLTDAARRYRIEARRHVDIRPEDWESAFEAPTVDPDRTLDVERLLQQLPTGQREVLHALAVEGVSVKTTAERFETSEGVIRMTFHRALERVAAAGRAVSPKIKGGGA